MADAPHFDLYLEYVNHGELKSMARMWGVPTKTPFKKDELVAYIRAGLADPARVRAAVQALTPFEQAALALMRWVDAPLEAGALAAGLRAAGIPLPNPGRYRQSDREYLVQPLVRRGLLLNMSYRSPAAYGSSYERAVLFTDPRLLAHAEPLRVAPLQLPPSGPPAQTLLRRPPLVALDIGGLIQAIRTLGGIKLTKQGLPRSADIRKLARALGWGEANLDLGGAMLPDPAGGFAAALRAAGVLTLAEDGLVLTPAAEAFTQRGYAEQAGALLRGFLFTTSWSELSGHDFYIGSYDRFPRGRLALALALMRLPADDEFYALDALDQALFALIGGHFSLTYDPSPFYSFERTPEVAQRAEREWHERMRANWLRTEARWLRAALGSWLYFLGIVELGLADGQIASFRLTELGRAVLRPHEAAPADQAAGPAWLAQPDFEVTVYLAHATPAQIAFIERHAERVQAQEHTARYRLTRTSVYQGLESGTTLDALLEGLRAGAGQDLPQNVLATIGEWAAQREQITLRKRAHLLEYPSAAARAAALAAGQIGAAVGERFVLLPPSELGRPLPYSKLDYTKAPPRNLAVSEDGRLRLGQPAPDLLIRPLLDRWAEPQGDGEWLLTAAGVQQAIRAGATLPQLTELLSTRLSHALPPLLGLALRAWAGRPGRAALAEVAVLRCTDPELFAALAGSELLRPYLRAALAPDLLLVDPRTIAELRARLAWAGLAIGDRLLIDG